MCSFWEHEGHYFLRIFWLMLAKPMKDSDDSGLNRPGSPQILFHEGKAMDFGQVSQIKLRFIPSTLVALVVLFGGNLASAGGPKYVAGASYFNPGVKGQALHWAGGRVNYFVDNGPLNASITNLQAAAMVDAAAAIWNAVPTAAVSLVNKGKLAEDVNLSLIHI